MSFKTSASKISNAIIVYLGGIILSYLDATGYGDDKVIDILKDKYNIINTLTVREVTVAFLQYLKNRVKV
jgi:hypothetical protein